MFAHLVRELQVPSGKVLALLIALNKPPREREEAPSVAVADIRKERERRKKAEN